MNRSMYKNCIKVSNSRAESNENCTWKSPRDEANEYSSVIVVNWMSEYSALRLLSIQHVLLAGKQTRTCT